MTNERRIALINAHRELRIAAFSASEPKVAAYLGEQRAALSSVKVASEVSALNPAVVQHLTEP